MRQSTYKDSICELVWKWREGRKRREAMVLVGIFRSAVGGFGWVMGGLESDEGIFFSFCGTTEIVVVWWWEE